MDTRDKRFDEWVREVLIEDIPVGKAMTYNARMQLMVAAKNERPLPSIAYATTLEMGRLTRPSLHEMWCNLIRFVTQEQSFHQAHVKASHCYIPQSDCYGGLSMHRMELMRQRWAIPI